MKTTKTTTGTYETTKTVTINGETKTAAFEIENMGNGWTWRAINPEMESDNRYSTKRECVERIASISSLNYSEGGYWYAA